jgi:hypothetical protein
MARDARCGRRTRAIGGLACLSHATRTTHTL